MKLLEQQKGKGASKIFHQVDTHSCKEAKGMVAIHPPIKPLNNSCQGVEALICKMNTPVIIHC